MISLPFRLCAKPPRPSRHPTELFWAVDDLLHAVDRFNFVGIPSALGHIQNKQEAHRLGELWMTELGKFVVPSSVGPSAAVVERYVHALLSLPGGARNLHEKIEKFDRWFNNTLDAVFPTKDAVDRVYYLKLLYKLADEVDLICSRCDLGTRDLTKDSVTNWSTNLDKIKREVDAAREFPGKKLENVDALVRLWEDVRDAERGFAKLPRRRATEKSLGGPRQLHPTMSHRARERYNI